MKQKTKSSAPGVLSRWNEAVNVPGVFVDSYATDKKGKERTEPVTGASGLSFSLFLRQNSCFVKATYTKAIYLNCNKKIGPTKCGN